MAEERTSTQIQAVTDRVPAAEPAVAPRKSPPEPKDSFREVVETVVFVVILVLLLKSFTAEAFVIPTGSMAETLYGYQKLVTCPQCDLQFPVNCSREVEETPPVTTTGCYCPSCNLKIELVPAPDWDYRKLITLVGAAFFGGLGISWAIGALARRKPSGQTLLSAQVVGTAVIGLAMYFWLGSTGGSGPAQAAGHPNREPPIFPANPNSGDRVLVAKFLYDSGVRDLERFDVVVFKFPEEPQRNHTPKNYIKRLIGLARETIGIHGGDLYVATGLVYDGPLEDERRFPVRRQIYKNLPRDVQLLESGSEEFKILRKPPHVLLALQRLVYDNDHQARDLMKLLPPRWAPEKDPPVAEGDARTAYLRKRQLARDDPAWANDGSSGFRHAARPGDVAWLRYRHLAPLDRPVEPRLDCPCEEIKDVMGYNNGLPLGGGGAQVWVGDLLLDCEVTVDQADGELVFELSKSVDRFQAVWQLVNGTCTLFRIDKDGQKQELDKKATTMRQKGKYRLRFANVDERLTVWVDGKLPFGDGVVYEPAREVPGDPKSRLVRSSYDRNDYEPVSIGVRGGAVSVRKLKISRDTYYTNQDGVQTMHVQPGHYLCMGDNSPQSSDSRSWVAEMRQDSGHGGGLVPKELMLGRAMLVYWPPNRFGTIR